MKFSIASISEAFSGIVQGLDGLFTSDEERLTAKNVIMGVQAQVVSKFLEYEAQVLEAKASIINTEAKGESFLQRNWRPMTMLAFVCLVIARWLGLTVNVTPELELELMSLIKIGLGGYVVGRSAEKIAKSVDFGKVRAKDK